MTAEELHHEIEQTRQRLGETVDELAAKTDVKARARAKAAELSVRVQGSGLLQRRWPVALAAGVLIAGSVAIWRWKKT